MKLAFDKKLKESETIEYIFNNISTIDVSDDKLFKYIDKIIKKYNYIILNSTEELNTDSDTSDFIVLIADTEFKLKIFTIFIKLFSQKITSNNNAYLTLDFEFREREVALMQLCFECDTLPYKYIWITDPNEFYDNTKNILIHSIITNKYVHKLLHGADSLDIPYLFEKFFMNEKQIIKDFMMKYIDTRFLCEYYRGSIDDGNKCAIYDALKYFDTINETQYNNLVLTHDNMGPVQNISWNIHTIDKYSTMYAYYDVVFLKKFINDIYTKAKRETPDKYIFYKYMPVISRFVILERRQITQVTISLKNIIDGMNNYLLIKENKTFTLINLFNYVSNKFNIKSIGFYYDLIMKVNYFRTQLMILFKAIVYSLIIENFKEFVFIKKNTPFTGSFNKNYIYDLIDTREFHKMIPLLNSIEYAYKKRLQNIFSSLKK